MVELIIKIIVDSVSTEESEKWLEELSQEEMFEFEVISSEVK